MNNPIVLLALGLLAAADIHLFAVGIIIVALFMALTSR
jgi:hypothetical protein